jgi:hypothetical protein
MIRRWICRAAKTGLVTEDCTSEDGGKSGTLHASCGWISV